MNILVTGAKGFAGRNIVENLKTIRDGKDRTRPDLRIDALYEYDLGNTPEELDAAFCPNTRAMFGESIAKAGKAFREATGGMELEGMGELEYYVIATKEDEYLPADQRGYHASQPFCKFEEFRVEAMKLIAECGGLIKYGHSEVGNFTVGDTMYEQNEIEFLPTTLEDYRGQGRKRHAHPHPHRQGRQEYVRRRQRPHRSGSQGHSWHTRPRWFAHRLRRHQPYILFPSGAPSGGSHQHLLGRPQPLGHGACASRLEQGQRQYDGALQPA